MSNFNFAAADLYSYTGRIYRVTVVVQRTIEKKFNEDQLERCCASLDTLLCTDPEMNELVQTVFGIDMPVLLKQAHSTLVNKVELWKGTHA